MSSRFDKLYYSVHHACQSLTPKQIDKGVIDAARKHLRTICGDSLDNLRGKNYEVSPLICDFDLSKIFLVPVLIVVVIVCDFADEFERRYYPYYFGPNASFDRCIPFFQHLELGHRITTIDKIKCWNIFKCKG